MSKKLKVFKIITNAIFVIAIAFFTYITIEVCYDMLNVEYGGLAILASLAILIYAIPVTLYCIVYGIVMIAKKRYKWYDLVIGLLYLISYASLILVPVLIA